MVPFQLMCLLEKATYENLLHIFLCYPILLGDVIDDMIYLVNTDIMFNLYDVDIE